MHMHVYGFGLLVPVVVTVLVSSTVTTDNVPIENKLSVRSCPTKTWIGLTQCQTKFSELY
jgi:hypothetical protein